jgi:hypothetical protein
MMVAHQNASVKLGGGDDVPAATTRTLRRYATDDGDDEDERERTQKDRKDCFLQVKTLRRKHVTLVAAAARGHGQTKKAMQAQFESSAAYRYQGKGGENHRLFVFSADLFQEASNTPWQTQPDSSPASAGIVEWMLQQSAPQDVLLFCDGRSRSARQQLETLTDGARHLSELWVVYQASRRLGRRVCFASANRETLLLSTPLPRNRLCAKERTSFNAAGEASTHDSTYTGVGPMPWGSMPRLSPEDKEKILRAKTSIPKTQAYDAALGVPLFWGERKTVPLWTQILGDLDVKCVYDLTPGSGTLARTCLELG